jgi:hypothetical protein
VQLRGGRRQTEREALGRFEGSAILDVVKAERLWL